MVNTQQQFVLAIFNRFQQQQNITGVRTNMTTPTEQSLGTRLACRAQGQMFSSLNSVCPKTDPDVYDRWYLHPTVSWCYKIGITSRLAAGYLCRCSTTKPSAAQQNTLASPYSVGVFSCSMNSYPISLSNFKFPTCIIPPRKKTKHNTETAFWQQILPSIVSLSIHMIFPKQPAFSFVSSHILEIVSRKCIQSSMRCYCSQANGIQSNLPWWPS